MNQDSSRSGWSGWAATLAVMMAQLLPASTAVAGLSPLAGGAGGQDSFEIRCPDGYSVSGLFYDFDGFIRIFQVEIVCGLFDQNGQLVTERRLSRNVDFKKHPYDGPNRGSGAQCRTTVGFPGIVDAFDGETARIALVGAEVVSSIRPGCRQVTPSGIVGARFPPRALEGRKTNFDLKRCPSGEVAVGMRGKFGSHLDSFGLICGGLKLAEAPNGLSTYDAPELLGPTLTGPTDPSRVKVGDRLNWAPVKGAESYLVNFSDFNYAISDNNASFIAREDPYFYDRVVTDNSLTIDRAILHLTHNSKFYWFVRACAKGGQRCSVHDGSNRVRMDFLPPTAFSIPEADSILKVGTKLAWKEVDGARSYRLCLGSRHASCRDRIADANSYVWSGDDLRRYMGSRLSIVVSPCASNGARCAPFVRSGSDIRRFQVDVLAAPEVVRPADGETTQIDGIGFEWRAVPFALNYKVCLKRDQFARECDTSTSVQAITVFARPDSFLDLSGFAGETIFWNVAGCVSSNCGLPSPARTLKVEKVRGRESKLLEPKSEPSRKVPKSK